MARSLLQAVADMDVWQEDDGTTNLYLHEHFGLSDPLGPVTEEIHAAEAEGLVYLRIGHARWWDLTEAGRAELAREDGS